MLENAASDQLLAGEIALGCSRAVAMIPPLVTPARSMDRSAAKLLDTYEKTDALE